MAVKIPLKMSDGATVRTIEELREHFNLADVLGYYSNGRLIRWLKDEYYDDETKKVEALDSSSEDFKKSLCDILGVDYSENEIERIDWHIMSKKNERREYLKKYTADDAILDAVDRVAFNQEELESLLKKVDSLETDNDYERIIYLCGEHFIIPASLGGVIYNGINKPTIEFDNDMIDAGIDFLNLEFDLDNYILSWIDDDDGCDMYGFMFFDLFDDNPLLGVKLLCMEAEKESVMAQALLGECYIEGFGVKKNEEEGIRKCQKAAEQGNAEAQYMLGKCYENGISVKKNYQDATKWYKKAAEQGHKSAKNQLCILKINYEYNRGGWCREKAEQGDAKAQYELGIEYMYVTNDEAHKEEAVKWFKKAAEQGHAEAQYTISMSYWIGDGVEKNKEEAVKWLKKAAERGHARSQLQLAEWYWTGNGVEKNKEEAVKWYKKAAEQGNAEAQHWLGMHYLNGDGVEKNKEEAAKWLKLAAQQGNEEAEMYLREV